MMCGKWPAISCGGWWPRGSLMRGFTPIIALISLSYSAAAQEPKIDPATIKIEALRIARNTEVTFEASFTFKNTNDFKVKDIKVLCDHKGPSGTKIDSNTRVIYRVIAAQGTLRVANFPMGFMHSQVTETTCWVVGISRAD